jgi:hypothetical protein
MKQIISRCGNICSECPWSTHMRKKIGKEDWEKYSIQIKSYIGFKPVKYEWEGCVGCLTPNNELPSHPFFNILKKCRTRKCGEYNEILNCAYCGRFPCANTVARNDITREKVSEKLGKEIDDNEYENYIKMFDAMENLNEIRSKLKNTQIKNPKPVVHKPEITKLAGEFKNEGFKVVYEKLLEIANSNLNIKDIDTVAGLEMYKTREEFLWRFLWIVVLFGEIDGSKLRIDSVTLYDNRKPLALPSNEEEWNLYFDILSKFDISVELEILTDKLYTPGGYMRSKKPKIKEPAYVIKMKGDSELQTFPFFKMMNEMLVDLQKKTAKRGFSNFRKLNFNSLLN